VVSIGCLVAAIAFAFTQPASFRRSSPLERHPGQFPAAPAAPETSAMPHVATPTLTVDIENVPPGYLERGTAFSFGNHLWFTARHVATAGCDQVVFLDKDKRIPGRVAFADPDADLAVLIAPDEEAPALPIETAAVSDDEHAYAFGYPKGMLGGTEDMLLGRAELKLAGRLNGMAPVLAWTEVARYPDDLESIAGISGGPMIDASGKVIGIIVAASVRRGRNYSVAPEMIEAIAKKFGASRDATPARDALAPPVALDRAAEALSKNMRIAEIYCVPPRPPS
jgi:S1-C subfamily serine protease